MVSRLSIYRDIHREAGMYRAGRDDVNALGDVLDTKPSDVRSLFNRELECIHANRREYYELFGPEKYEDALEDDIVEIFENNPQR